jgi:hypothetical protein
MTNLAPADRDANSDQERSQALAKIINAGDVVIDVGANRGQFALELLALT